LAIIALCVEGGDRITGLRLTLPRNGPNSSYRPFVEPDSVLFSGDVSMAALPAAGGSSTIATWVASQDRFAALQPRHVVPSHGPLGDASMIAKNREFLTTVRTRAAALKKQGTTVDDAGGHLRRLAPYGGHDPHRIRRSSVIQARRRRSRPESIILPIACSMYRSTTA
jgi:glyoxylase-like metal-dependent hydrolase (beta-lactamase superfamily II)